MRTAYVVTARATEASINAVRGHNPQLAALMAEPMVQHRLTKRAADRLASELSASGAWDVSRSTALVGTIEDAFMHTTGLCPAR